MTNYNPSSCIKNLKHVTTVSKALTAGTPSIARMVKFFGETKVEAYIKLWLVSLNESVNLKRPLKENQIDECAIRIVSKHRHVTIADINIIFNRAKMGEYGEFFESLSMPKILKWFKDYFEERCEVAAFQSQRESDLHKYKAEKVQRVMPEQTQEFKEFLKDYNINQLNEKHKQQQGEDKE